jgi:hypothetical protein
MPFGALPLVFCGPGSEPRSQPSQAFVGQAKPGPCQGSMLAFGLAQTSAGLSQALKPQPAQCQVVPGPGAALWAEPRAVFRFSFIFVYLPF